MSNDDLKSQLSKLHDLSVVGHPIRIADNDLNRKNDFYRPLIGQEGVIIDLEEDGLYDIALPTYPLLQGLKKERFDFLPVTQVPVGVMTWQGDDGTEFKETPYLGRKRWNRLVATLILLTILSIITGIILLTMKLA